MESIWSDILWRQFGAAIDMLENDLRACPEELWAGRLWNIPEQPGGAEFWYIAYHTLFWLDLYLGGSGEGFTPPAPYDLSELDPSGLLPGRRYTKDELLSYLEHSRQKCRAALAGLTDEQASRQCKFPWGQIRYAELLLYNMRHVQEHGAQLSMYLGQQVGTSARWVGQTKKE